MYLFDLFANIFRKKNFGVLIWLIINTVIVSFCFTVLIDIVTGSVLEDWLEYLLGFVAYLGTMVIALSPIGEAMLRWQNGCKKITDKETLSRLGTLFEEVREKAVKFDEKLNRNIKFYISDDEAPNAFATGRKTVCVTKGLLALDDDEIKGVLAHEFGHLSHKDTDVILVVAVGNMFVAIAVSAVSLIVRLFNWVIGFIIGMFSGSERGGFIVGFLTSKFNFLVSLLFGAVLWLWTKLGILICMSSSRQNEFHADKFAFEIGLGNELKSALIKLEEGESVKSRGLWSSLSASHPDTDKRIEKLDSYSGFSSECASSSFIKNSKTVSIPVSDSEIKMLRGFSSRFENNTVITEEEKEPVAEIKKEKNSETAKIAVSKDLSLNFHKANIYFIVPVSIILAFIDLVMRGLDLSAYGTDAVTIAGVVANFATVLFSVNALYDFVKRQSNAFVSMMIARVAMVASWCIVSCESYGNFIMYGLDDSAAIFFTVLIPVCVVGFAFITYNYYSKRKNILFDKCEDSCIE